MGLALRYRPQSFDDFVGQQHIVQVVRAAIKQNRLPSAVLFSGTRGSGKTSMARVVAKALNCKGESKPCGECQPCLDVKAGNFPWLREIDTASNRGIDAIKEIVKIAQFAPPKGMNAVWIMDECHRLTNEGADAFLKALEEPPPNTYFILCTTEEMSMIDTIRSRCMRFHFRHLGQSELSSRLKKILDDSKVTYDEGSIQVIVNAAKGSMRDAITLLETCLVSDNLTRGEVSEILCMVDVASIVPLFDKICAQDSNSYIDYMVELIRRSSDPALVRDSVGRYLHDLLIISYGCEDLVNESDDVKGKMEQQAKTLGRLSLKDLLDFWESRTDRFYMEVAAVEIFLMRFYEEAVKRSIDKAIIDALLLGVDNVQIVTALPRLYKLKTEKATISIVTDPKLSDGYYIPYDDVIRTVKAGGNLRNVVIRKPEAA